MLDLRQILETPDAVKKNLTRRGFDVSVIDEIVRLGRRRSEVIQTVESLKAKRNQLSKEVGMKKAKKEDATELVHQTGAIGDEIKKFDDELSGVQVQVDQLLYGIPNLLHESVPDGRDESSNVEIRRWGKAPSFSFSALAHDEIGEKLGLLDFERAAKITGARFSLLWADAARLERALIQFMLNVHTEEHGYTETLPPFIVNSKSLTGTGQLPKFSQDVFRLDLPDVDYYLVPTAEVPVTNIHANEVIDEEWLPLAYCAYTPCFRSEAGSYGRDTKGLIRQHQFNKIELVRFSRPEDGLDQLELLTSHAEAILKKLELHYRVMALSSGDIGFGAHKTYDLEVWLPGQKAFREISSCSVFSDFQARRAQIRCKKRDDKKPRLLYTLNGSGLAVGRTLVAIFENYQDESGRIAIPKALQPYMGGRTHLESRRK